MPYTKGFLAAALTLAAFSGAQAATVDLPRPLLPASQAQREVLRPLAFGAESLSLSGEIASREMPVYLTSAEAARKTSFTVTYENAVSVMPEASRLTLKINDVIVGETAIEGAAGPRKVTFAVPPGLLEGGFNAVRISARQLHRVDCSLDASYELWTRVIPAESGFVFSGPSDIRSLRDLAAVKPRPDGSVAIRLRVPSGIDAESLARQSRAVQAMAMASGIQNPAVELNAEPREDAGIDLIVGTIGQLRALGIETGAIARQSVEHDPRTDRVTVTLAAANVEELDRMIGEMNALGLRSEAPGTREGRRALASATGRAVSGDETFDLADLGFETQSFFGRHYQQALRVMLPADYYPGDYGRVKLKLDAAYAQGLAPSSELRVRVNGAQVGTVRMPRSGGGTLQKQEIGLPLRTFKPGLNSIEIVASTRVPGEDACDPAAIANTRDRLVVLNTSEITFPRLARVGSLPNVSAMMGGGLNMTGGKPVTIYVPNGAPGAINAAVSLLTKIAGATGQETKASFSFARPAPADEHALVIGRLDDVPVYMLEAAGIDGAALRKAWSSLPEPGATPQSSLPTPVRVAAAGGINGSLLDTLLGSFVTDTGAVAGRSGGTLAQAVPSDAGSDLLGAWRNGFSSGGGSGWLNETVREPLSQALAKLSMPSVIELINQQGGQRLASVTNGSTLVISQGARSTDVGSNLRSRLMPKVASTMVVVAPTDELLVEGIARLLAGGAWANFSSGTAAYTPATGGLSTGNAAETFLVETAPFSIGNARLIVASWLSENVLAYLALIFGATLLLAVLTTISVRVTGVRTQ